MLIAEVLMPVHVCPAVRYTGEVLAFPGGAGRSFPKTLETGAFEIIDCGLTPQKRAAIFR